MGRILLGWGLALAAAAPEARAGAWLAPEGGQEVWTHAVGERAELTTYESALYLELPVGAQSAIVVTPWVEQANDLDDLWRGEAVMGVKREMFRGAASLMAVQVGALWRSDPPAQCGEGGVEVRWLGGHSPLPPHS